MLTTNIMGVTPAALRKIIDKKTYEITIGGKSPENLLAALKNEGIRVDDWAWDMMIQSQALATLDKPIKIRVSRLTPRDLGFAEPPTTKQLFTQALSLGLELVPAEAGPWARLQDTDQPGEDWYYIAMNPMDRGTKRVFRLGRSGDRRRLEGYWANPDDLWPLDRAVVFGIPQGI